MAALTARDHSRLVGVDPRLVKVVNLAATKCPIAFMVVEGVRSDEQCFINFGKGRSVAECAAKGVPAKYAQPKAAKVTWLADPLNSMHRKKADGYGKAVDLLPAPFDWKDAKPFALVNDAMMAASKELGIPIRWGKDWNRNGKPGEKGETDSPHWELLP